MPRLGYKQRRYPQTIKWNMETKARFRESFKRGGLAAIAKDFPELRETQVRSAVRLYVTEEISTLRPIPIDRDEVRWKIAALSPMDFFEGLQRMMMLRAANGSTGGAE